MLLLNRDTIVRAGAIDALVAGAPPSDAAVVGPRLVDGRGRAGALVRADDRPVGEFRQKAVMARLERGTSGAVRRVDRMTRRRQLPDWVSGACLLVRRADAEAVGLFDERYFM